MYKLVHMYIYTDDVYTQVGLLACYSLCYSTEEIKSVSGIYEMTVTLFQLLLI